MVFETEKEFEGFTIVAKISDLVPFLSKIICTKIEYKDHLGKTCITETYTHLGKLYSHREFKPNNIVIDQISFFSKDSRYPFRYFDKRYTLLSIGYFCDSLFYNATVGVRLATVDEKLDIIKNIKSTFTNDRIISAAKRELELK